MMSYDGVADGCQGTMAYLGRMKKSFSAGNLQENMPGLTV
jgi:hypothetical protein